MTMIHRDDYKGVKFHDGWWMNALVYACSILLDRIPLLVVASDFGYIMMISKSVK